MNNLLFDFTVDKSAKTVYITRAFHAELSLVWDAFTKAEILDQWWAPKPLLSLTKAMDFKVGGRRFYAMANPDGEPLAWQVQEYTAIHPKTDFSFLNVFADKDENRQLPGSNWDLHFSEEDGITTVRITIYNDSLERMEKMIEMGFQQGFTMTLTELDSLLIKLNA